VRKRKQSRTDVRTVAEFAEHHGGISYAREVMMRHASQARNLLGSLPGSEARDAMVALIEFSVTRRK
jgi:octaprenyl-diphosphate synthase